ncbi:hypothetical protein LYNGBM3L_10800 [Moorena producens 3L]|uniref:Uncharacterized protein n=1 Tax=Moorena producens 3L TaxID=489825 RepID=F4XJZ9_9CYAN|nr:hypothetical protein LYNGBM3L_10800 [Moorena producens 3L]OLT65385.1 hypothetical protein BI334_10305 [Moorena producens 3L]
MVFEKSVYYSEERSMIDRLIAEVKSQKSFVRSQTLALLDAVAHGGNPQDRAASLTKGVRLLSCPNCPGDCYISSLVEYPSILGPGRGADKGRFFTLEIGNREWVMGNGEWGMGNG